jgi:putative ATPase
MKNLFNQNEQSGSPLAEKLRPKNLEDFFGQEHLTQKNQKLYKMILNDKYFNFVLWGPSGSGKTSLAKIIKNNTKKDFINFSAVEQGVNDLRKIVKQAKENLEFHQKETILFVDEIHRLNKTQQDAFLPHAEQGTFVLIGASTENPSFSLNNALLSRLTVLKLKSLKKEDLEKIFFKTCTFLNLSFEEKAKNLLISYANYDARKLINVLEIISKQEKTKNISIDFIKNFLPEKLISYDNKSEEYYNMISAYIKSLRASDVNASLYYLARILKAGTDPRFLARRLIIFASEDIGLANNNALLLANSLYQASEKIGMPEIKINLAHISIYFAQSPKNKQSYLAIKKAFAEIEESGFLKVPLHLTNTSTDFLKEINKNFNSQKISNFPVGVKNTKFF